MIGVDKFVKNNFDNSISIFNKCLMLILYAYDALQKEQVYSRKHILEQTIKIRKRNTSKLELEDYLRNDLVENFIIPNRSRFDLDYFMFISGVEEFSENVKVGILDIKVCSPLLNNNIYFVLECKRLNKQNLDEYITEGVIRFVDEKYYCNSDIFVAGMISFLEYSKAADEIRIVDSFNIIDKYLKKFHSEIKLLQNLTRVKLSSTSYKFIDNYNFIFLSKHGRVKKLEPIDIYHIVLDYSNIITD
jgi:hypothetical protein